MNTYISAQGGRHTVKIKGLDDKGGHEERWICNGFTAVVKILKVSTKSASTHPLKKKWKKKCKNALSEEIMPRGREDDEHYFIFLTEMKGLPVWQKVKVWVVIQQRLCGPRSSLKFGSLSFVISIQLLHLCFILTLPSAPPFERLCLCLSHERQGHKLEVFLWTEVERWGNHAQAPVKGEQKGMSHRKLYWGHVCISDWKLSQTPLNHIRTSAISAQRKRQWKRKPRSNLIHTKRHDGIIHSGQLVYHWFQLTEDNNVMFILPRTERNKVV